MSKLGNLRFLAANTFADAWNKAEAGYAYFIDITGNTDSPTTTANRWFGQMWKNDTGKYGWQVVWSFNGTIYKRERNNSDVWTDWNTYALKSDLTQYIIVEKTTDDYGQISLDKVYNIKSLFCMGDRRFASWVGDRNVRITDSTGEVIKNASVKVIVGYKS